MCSWLSALTLLASCVVAQNATTTSSQSGVPTGSPVPGNYSGSLRPQIHYSPPKGFMNDPNGMFVDANGTWHLYYQYNPTDVVAGNQHWGHATSTDLYTWHNQEIALFPDIPEEGIFSGSIVIDFNNTSGMFPNQDNGVVAFYTLNTPVEQTQDVAFSYDGGYTFVKYDKNPIIRINSTQFRDPKVIWHSPSQKWAMVLAYSQDFTIGIYTSPNLLDWTHASNFSHKGLLGLQYECPNMVSIPMEGSNELMWIMAISINPGAPLGGSITEYFVGHFNGTHFEAVDDAARIADFGKDNYAAQWFYGTPDGASPVSIAWASNWQYTNVVPTGSEGWRSVMSLPRVNHLANTTRLGYTLVSKPYNLSTVLESQLIRNSSLGNGTVQVGYGDVSSGAIYFQANFSGIPKIDATGTANFTFSSETGESLSGGFFLSGDTPFWLDRGKLRGFDNPFFTDKFSTNNLINEQGTWEIEGIIDRSIFEVFLEGGKRSATLSIFPDGKLDRMTFSTAGLSANISCSVAIWSLKSTWAAQTDADGLVAGNITSTH